MDPYIISPAERARFEQQFNALKPINGIVTGDQAKGLLLQSQLPPPILGVIWALADTDADGKMNINEFCIACKLISMKLRGFDLPKALPPALKALVEQPGAGAMHSKPPIPPLPNSASGGLLMMASEPGPPTPMPVGMRAISPPSGGPTPVTSPPLGTAGPPPKPPLPVLPPQPVMALGGQAPVVPVQPLGGQVPIVPAQPLVGMNPVQPMIPGQLPLQGVPLIPGMTAVPPMKPAVPPAPAVQPGMGMMSSTPPLVQTGMPTTVTPGMSPVTIPPVGGVPVLPAVPPQAGLISAVSPPNTLVGLGSTQPSPPTQPTPPTPPIAVATSQPPTVERVLSMESPLGSSSPLVEWAVPQASKLKYTQLFNTTDKTRSGYLTGVQARNILLASKLPQPILAQIWALSDMDADGRLSCEEFVLALHLCDMARAGETLPATLPPNLVPPTLRRVRNNSLTSSEQGDLTGTGINQVTFEDKRKENFEKGQAELDRRRKALLEIQRKEQEERERKEREEREKQEKIRLEQEKKRQEEFERQLERQREIEKAKEEERRRAQEQREAARKEMERQRQLEWEKQRLQELQTQRQKQQEQVLALKAKSQALTIELSQKEETVKELSKKISETRCGVTSVKSVIDGMRVSRDQNLAEYNRLKAVLKQTNARTLALSQQKAKLEAAGKLGKEEKERDQAAFDDKALVIKNLKDKLKDLEDQVKQKEIDVENNNSQLESLKEELSTILKDCEEMFSNYADKRNEILAKKGITLNEAPAGAWGTSAWDNAPTSAAWDSAPSSAAWPEDNQETPGYTKYRALYEFVARNSDELSFQPGDIIMVPDTQNAEPGWLSGELRGMSGWFPETYVEPVSAGFNGSSEIINTQLTPKTPLEGIVEVAESETGSVVEEGPPLPSGLNPMLGMGQAVNKTARAAYTFNAVQGSQISFMKGDVIRVTEIQDQWCYGQLNLSEGWFPKSYVIFDEEAPISTSDQAGEYYIALYPYVSDESGDLTFEQNEVILVTAKDGEWWTGQIGDSRTGIFPSNYVQPYSAAVNTEQPVEEVKQEEPPAVEPVVEKKPISPVSVDNQTPGERKVVTPDFAALASQVDSGSGDELESKGKGKKPLIATVIVPYQATSKEQLSLQRGQLIMIRKKTTTGWWEGELQAKGKKRQVGWFPASYVKLLGGSGRGSQPQSRKSSESGLSDALLERVVALYQYTAQNEDELSFEKGDIVTVLAKDEPSWWKGELNGAVGLFPSNYVAPQQLENEIRAAPSEPESLNSFDNGPTTKIHVSKEEKKRQQAIKELIVTEQAYIDDMSIVYDVFERPLLESRLLTNEQMKTIFINWHDILECNYSFLRALRVRRDMSKGGIIRTIGDILCENLPRMKVYVRFCGCQLRAAALLQNLTETNKDFLALTKRCQSDPRTKGLPLSSFLIKPMQRITKYPLLILKILDHTPPDHSDRQYLEEAFAKAEELCSQVNEGVREKENSERLEWLQSHVLSDRLSEPLIFNSLTNAIGPRKFLHFGALTKTKSGKELIGFLMNDFLLLAQPNRPLGGQFNFEKHQNILFRIYKQPLLLNELIIHGSVGEPNGVEFKLENNKVIYNLSATTQNEKNLWLKKLTQAQNELREQEKDKFRRQQSKQASFGAVGRILVFVMEGSKLKATTVHREVFCELSMGSQESRTPAVTTPNGSDPKWNTSMQFLVKDLEEDVLCITVKDKGNFSPDEFLGRTELRVSEILSAIEAQGHGPIIKTLKLHEARSGEVKLKLDVSLFNNKN